MIHRYLTFVLLLGVPALVGNAASPDVDREESRFWHEIDSLQKHVPEMGSEMLIPVDSAATTDTIAVEIVNDGKFILPVIDSLLAAPLQWDSLTGLSFEQVLGFYNAVREFRQRLDQLEVRILFDQLRVNPDNRRVRAALESAKARMRKSALLYWTD